MTTSRPYILWAVLSAAGILSGSSTVWGKDLPTQTGEIFAMDTYMTVSATGENAKEAVDASLEEIQKLDALWSVGNEDSVVSRLNRNESVELDEDTSGLLQKALEISTDTDRAFDITVYPLMEEWCHPGSGWRNCWSMWMPGGWNMTGRVHSPFRKRCRLTWAVSQKGMRLTV